MTGYGIWAKRHRFRSSSRRSTKIIQIPAITRKMIFGGSIGITTRSYQHAGKACLP